MCSAPASQRRQSEVSITEAADPIRDRSPTRIWPKPLHPCFSEMAPKALNYGTAFGYDKLRDLVVDKLMRHEDIEIRRENVLITHGASNAISLFADTFLDIGDPIIVEAPTFMGSFAYFRSSSSPDHRRAGR